MLGGRERTRPRDTHANRPVSRGAARSGALGACVGKPRDAQRQGRRGVLAKNFPKAGYPGDVAAPHLRSSRPAPHRSAKCSVPAMGARSRGRGLDLQGLVLDKGIAAGRPTTDQGRESGPDGLGSTRFISQLPCGAASRALSHKARPPHILMRRKRRSPARSNALDGNRGRKAVFHKTKGETLRDEDGEMSGNPATKKVNAPAPADSCCSLWKRAWPGEGAPPPLSRRRRSGLPRPGATGIRCSCCRGLPAGDASTALLRRFLISRGFSPSGWGQGLNLGLREGVMERAHERIRELWAEHGRTVSLVGWSLGGLYARELAKHSPEMVRLVITLGSPFTGHPRETNAWRLYEFASGHRVDWHDFHLPLRWAPAGADDLDLEPDRRRRPLALLLRAAHDAGREHRRRIRATSGSARIRRRCMPLPTGSRSPRAIGSRSTATAGGASSTAIREAPLATAPPQGLEAARRLHRP